MDPMRRPCSTSSMPPPLRERPGCRAPAQRAPDPGARSSARRQDAGRSGAGTARDAMQQLRTLADRFDRQRSAPELDVKRALVMAAQQILDEVVAYSAERCAIDVGAAVVAYGAAHGAASAAGLWLDAMELGLELINRANRAAREGGVRAHEARGLAQTLTRAARDPDAPLSQIREQAVAAARRQYEAQAAADYLARGGIALDKDHRARDLRFEGLRRGIERALRLLAPLPGDQRRALADAARARGGGDLEAGFARLARAATGADSNHARLRGARD